MTKLLDNIRVKHFLVTDDYQSMQVMLGEHLRQIGVEKISFAKSGNEAYKTLQDTFGTPNQIDFVLSDFNMEDGTGLELLKLVRANPNFKNLPFVMITSQSDVSVVIECVKAGVTSYIVKPWEVPDLAKKITDSYQKHHKS